ncbi:MAG: transposase [Chloroflexi bacterium]|nr:transposase [Chloroflexota bacterium]
MIARYARLRSYPGVFRALTGLRLGEFDGLVADLLPAYRAAEEARLARPTTGRPTRLRAIGGGSQFALGPRDQLLLSVVWLRQYPTHLVLGYLFGISDRAVRRLLGRVLPLLEQAGRDGMRGPRATPQRSRRDLSDLLAAVPELAVLVDTFEQPVQRPRDRTEADGYYSGKKKRHTLKVQVAVARTTGRIVDVPRSVPGPTADLTLLKQSGLLHRLPPDVAVGGDLAYVGIAAAHPTGQGFTPRRKPRGRDRPRPPEDVAYNTAFARQRIGVEHSIGRLRHYECLTQRDRHHRQHHTARVVAVAGLVHRALDMRFPNGLGR